MNKNTITRWMFIELRSYPYRYIDSAGVVNTTFLAEQAINEFNLCQDNMQCQGDCEGCAPIYDLAVDVEERHASLKIQQGVRQVLLDKGSTKAEIDTYIKYTNRLLGKDCWTTQYDQYNIDDKMVFADYTVYVHLL